MASKGAVNQRLTITPCSPLDMRSGVSERCPSKQLESTDLSRQAAIDTFSGPIMSSSASAQQLPAATYTAAMADRNGTSRGKGGTFQHARRGSLDEIVAQLKKTVADEDLREKHADSTAQGASYRQGHDGCLRCTDGASESSHSSMAKLGRPEFGFSVQGAGEDVVAGSTVYADTKFTSTVSPATKYATQTNRLEKTAFAPD